MNSRNTALIGVLLLCSAMAPGSAYAAERSKAWLYVVPFTCGEASLDDTTAVPGKYASAITVTNDNLGESRTRSRADLTVPERASSDIVGSNLAPVSALTIDCEGLKSIFTFEINLDPEAYRQGVILLGSQRPIVVQVQTTVLGATGGPSLSQQTVKGRRVWRPENHWAVGKSVVELCHIPPGNPFAAHSIFVHEAAVSAHLGHDDYIGPCAD